MSSARRPSAICPAFFMEYRDVGDFLEQFGPYSGRYVYDLPSGAWMKGFQDHLKELPGIQRHKVMSQYEKIKNALVKPPKAVLRGPRVEVFEPEMWGPYVSGPDVFSSLNPEHCVGYALKPEPFPEWSSALEEIRDTRQDGWLIEGRIKDFVDAIEPLFQRGPAAYVVDPYFRVLHEHQYLLIKMLEQMANTDCYKIHIVADKDSNNDKELKAKFKEIYERHIPENRSLHLHLVARPGEAENYLRLHERYFLTLRGALEFGGGYRLSLGSAKKTPQNPVSVVSKVLHQDLVRKYIEGLTGGKAPGETKKNSYPRPKSVRSFAVPENATPGYS